MRFMFCTAWPTSAFQEVVYAGRDEQLTAVFLNVDECLIGVHHLLQVDGLVAIVGESCILIEVHFLAQR